MRVYGKILIVLCNEMWDISREMDGFGDFLDLYPWSGQISRHLLDQQYMALFRIVRASIKRYILVR